MENAFLQRVVQAFLEAFPFEDHNAFQNDWDYVLFRHDHQWKAAGPVDYSTANTLVQTFNSLDIRCFICLEEEFQEKGVPSDSMAANYFPENELDWEMV